MRDLIATLVQTDLLWENPEANRERFSQALRGLAVASDLVVLPEMFTTGFSMQALANAELPGGVTEQWLRSTAHEMNCAITGSIPVNVDGKVYNRMLFATPDECFHYDKRHLFRMAGEHEAYAPGTERVIVEWRDWRIKLEVCYDLRFPVFSRNRQDYDLLLNVANWPAKRAHHWRSLLQARAIENQVCVIGVNRVGRDGVNVEYSGDSLAIDAVGMVMTDMQSHSACETVCLDAAALCEYRERFPAHLDADDFSLGLG
ncbi:MAG: amidohydrolase [Congregibacter sp.]